MALGRKRIRLGEILVREGCLNEEELARGLALQKGTGKRLGEILVENAIVTGEDLARALSNQLGYARIDMLSVDIPQEILDLVPVNVLKKHGVLPFSYKPDAPNTLLVAMSDPMDLTAIDDVSIVTNLSVEPVVSTNQGIMLALDKFFGQGELKTAAEQYAAERVAFVEEAYTESEDILNSPIVQLVTNMVESAVRQRASDIHIEPLEKSVRVRYRIDGALYDRASYQIAVLPAIVTRVKIISGMDISEKRKPQDGRMTQVVDRLEYDIRVSSIPTVFGEKVVLRIASKTALNRSKDQLGMRKEEIERFDHIISNPHGIFLVTGPTGSGKSTTLYTALSALNKEEVNIITVEDPVEANLNGVNQIQVNPRAELTFASALRSILRQDPDIIMIGEIRDNETAQIAVQASITGHLVVSTLHTNSAASTLTRLMDMGVEPYLLADSMVGVIAQRLVRKLCPDCKKPVEATTQDKVMLRYPGDKPLTIYDRCGCSKCGGTGFIGRTGVYEIMEITPVIKRIIEQGGNAEDIKEQALTEGMQTLRMSASRYVLEGITTMEEMRKVSFDT